MLQLSLSTSLMPPTAPGAGPNPASSGVFALVLADALSPIAAPAADGGTIAIAGAPRQAAADPGKTLPIDVAKGADAADPALAWLAFTTPATPSAGAQKPSAAPAANSATDTALPQTADQTAPGKQPVESITIPVVVPTTTSSPAPAAAPDTTNSSGPIQQKKKLAKGAVPDAAAGLDPTAKTPAAAPTDAMPVAVPSPFARPPANEGHKDCTHGRHGGSAPRHKKLDAGDGNPVSGAAAAVIATALPTVKAPDSTAAPSSLAGVAPTSANPASTIRAVPVGLPSSLAEAVAVTAAPAAATPTDHPSTAAASQTPVSPSAVAPTGAPATSKAFSLPAGKQNDALDLPLVKETTPVIRSAPASAAAVTATATPSAPRQATTTIPLPQVRPAATGGLPAAPADSAIPVANAASGAAVSSVTPPSGPAPAAQTVIVSPVTAPDHSTAAAPSGERPAAPAAVAASPTPAAQQATPAPAVAAPQPAPPALAQPAGVVFGIALSAAVAADQRPALDDKTSPRDAALQALTAAAGSAQPLAMVAAAGGAQHGALDTRRDDWPQAMIDRIEALRDAADAQDTSIRLVPDALGKVDVSIRHDGDAVHVHFAAEAPATQQLIADAQPRLADAAQARGLRLGQTSVDGGNAGTGASANQQHQQQQGGGAAPQSRSPIRPARAPVPAAPDGAAAPDSTRLA